MLRDAERMLRGEGAFAVGAPLVPWLAIGRLLVVAGLVYGATMGALGWSGVGSLFSALKLPILLAALQSRVAARLALATVHRQADASLGAVADDKLLSAEEVANLLGVPRRYVYDLARRGVIPSVRVGKYLRPVGRGSGGKWHGELRPWIRRVSGYLH